MADLGGRVFVSWVDSEEFAADPEVGGFTHTLFDDGVSTAGLWKPGSDVGDMASMPKGAVTTWHPSADFEEIWFYS